MPELPEVEVVRRQLERSLVGREIERVETSKPSYFFITPPSVLKRNLVGQKVTRLSRVGKYILVHFRTGDVLLCHLGMTGQLTARPVTPDEHTHLVLGLDGGTRITFRDVRKFGKVEFIAAGKRSARLDKLGPDALTIPSEDFVLRLRKRNVAVKVALLNQAVLAGVGNIYADEALYASGILPTKPAKRVSRTALLQLHAQLRKILEESIAGGGSTINDYMKPDGELGSYQNWHRVYGKRNEPCPGCGAPLRHRTLGGRSTHFCSRCQR